MTLRIIDPRSPLVFDPAEGLDVQIPAFQLVTDDTGICLICGALSIGYQEQDDRHTFSQRADVLKTLCEILQVSNTGTILEKFEDDRMRCQVKFCNGCHQSLQTYNNLQIQLQELNSRINELKGLISRDFRGDSDDPLLSTPTEGTELRHYILTECARLDAKDEQDVITVLTNPISILSYESADGCEGDDTQPDNYSDREESILGDFEWKPRNSTVRTRSLSTTQRHRRLASEATVNESQHITKPCQVKLIRIDDEGSGGVELKRMRLERKKRLRLLIQKFKKKKDPSSAKRRKLSRTEPNAKRIKRQPRRRAGPRRKETGKCSCPVPFCLGRFQTERDLGYHIKQVHEGNEKPFNCIACDGEYGEVEELRAHIKEDHVEVHCPTCGKYYINYKYLADHIRRQGGTCSFEPLPLNSTVDRSSQDPKKFACGECGQRFSRPYLLRIHSKAAHTDGFAFICEFCSKPFKREQSLKTHHLQQHPQQYKQSFNVDEKTFLKEVKDRHCDICKKTFVSIEYKKVHEAMHANQYKFRCEVCGVGCANKQQLTTHQLIHKPKDQVCPHCPIRFGRVDKLKRHLTTVHMIGGKGKEFACEFCPNLFWDNFALQRHKRLKHRDQLPEGEKPTMFRCEPCNYICHDKSYLRIHEKTRRHKDNVVSRKPDTDFVIS